MPPNTVSVCRPGKWGNPFMVKPGRLTGVFGACYSPMPTAESAVACFRLMLKGPECADLVSRIRSELRGKNLACFCPLDRPCHADVLLELANEVEI